MHRYPVPEPAEVRQVLVRGGQSAHPLHGGAAGRHPQDVAGQGGEVFSIMVSISWSYSYVRVHQTPAAGRPASERCSTHTVTGTPYVTEWGNFTIKSIKNIFYICQGGLRELRPRHHHPEGAVRRAGPLPQPTCALQRPALGQLGPVEGATALQRGQYVHRNRQERQERYIKKSRQRHTKRGTVHKNRQ